MIEVKNLSSDIDLESFRVAGLGTARLLVATCSLDRYPDIPISDPIHVLKDQVCKLTDEKGALEMEITILKGFGGKMASMPDLTPDSANAFSDKLFEKTLSNAAAIRELDAKLAELGQKTYKLGAAKTSATDARAVVTIVADETGPAQLRLTYRESSPLVNLRHCIDSSPPRRVRRPMAFSLRLVRIVARWKAVHVCLVALSGEPLAEDGRGLERREADSQHI